MICFPNAKINLGLFITEKRGDGYHNIESVMLPVGWSDALEVVRTDTARFETTGNPVPGKHDDISCFKAYKLLSDDFHLLPVHMHLHKIVPHGAGLGGGSSDGAFALKLLNTFFSLNLSSEDLKGYAGKLGSDAPFFIDNVPAFCHGKGDHLQTIRLDLKGYHYLLVNPGIHSNTAEAYADIKPKPSGYDLRNLDAGDIKNWQAYVKNDFEEGLFKRYPVLAQIKSELYGLGAVYASMSGSGSSVFGIFENHELPVKIFSNRFAIWAGHF